jgi:hypothetical protein
MYEGDNGAQWADLEKKISKRKSGRRRSAEEEV